MAAFVWIRWQLCSGIRIPGRTGHDYQNRFIGNELVWYGKTNSSVKQDSIRSMLEPDGNIYIFFREEDRAPFSFAGKATVKSHKDTVPVEITWTFALTKQLLRISNYASKVTVCQDRLACQVVQPLSKQALRSSSKGLTVIDNTRKLFLTLYIVTYCTCVYVSRRHAGHRLPNL